MQVISFYMELHSLDRKQTFVHSHPLLVFGWEWLELTFTAANKSSFESYQYQPDPEVLVGLRFQKATGCWA